MRDSPEVFTLDGRFYGLSKLRQECACVALALVVPRAARSRLGVMIGTARVAACRVPTSPTNRPASGLIRLRPRAARRSPAPSLIVLIVGAVRRCPAPLQLSEVCHGRLTMARVHSILKTVFPPWLLLGCVFPKAMLPLLLLLLLLSLLLQLFPEHPLQVLFRVLILLSLLLRASARWTRIPGIPLLAPIRLSPSSRAACSMPWD